MESEQEDGSGGNAPPRKDEDEGKMAAEHELVVAGAINELEAEATPPKTAEEEICRHASKSAAVLSAVTRLEDNAAKSDGRQAIFGISAAIIENHGKEK